MATKFFGKRIDSRHLFLYIATMKMTPEFKTARRQAQKALAEFLTPCYFDGIPVGAMSEIMERHGFDVTEFDGIYCGETGQTIVSCAWSQNSEWKVYVTFAWHKMGSGKMEIVGYVSF
jgi:hypothetical protein